MQALKFSISSHKFLIPTQLRKKLFLRIQMIIQELSKSNNNNKNNSLLMNNLLMN